MKCPICEKGNLEKVEDIILDVSGYIFIVSGERCNSCKEEFVNEKDTQKTIEISKRLGVWPEPMKLYRHLTKSAGGLIFRIHSDLERQLSLNEKTEIAITKIGNKIVIEPDGNI